MNINYVCLRYKKIQQQQSSCTKKKRNIPTITEFCDCIQPLKHDIKHDNYIDYIL